MRIIGHCPTGSDPVPFHGEEQASEQKSTIRRG